MSSTDGSASMATLTADADASIPSTEAVKESAEGLTARVHSALDGATQHVVEEIEGLIGELEAMKDRVLKSGAMTKDLIAMHINIAPEAHELAQHIREKFTALIHPRS